VIIDISEKVTDGLRTELSQYDDFILVTQKEIEKIQHEMNSVEKKIMASRGDFFRSVSNLEKGLLANVKDISTEELETFLDSEIGRHGDEIGQKLRIKIELEVENFFEQSSGILEGVRNSINNHIIVSENMLDDIVTKSLKKSGKAIKRISNVDEGKLKQGIFAARDIVEKVFKKNIKFKPWAASKWAKRIAKYSGPIGMGIEMLGDAVNLAQKSKAENQLAIIKNELSDLIKEHFKTVYDLLENDDEFVTTFAPQIKPYRQIIINQEEALNDLFYKKEKLTQIDIRLLEMKQEIAM
jgi:hypothetical protein